VGNQWVTLEEMSTKAKIAKFHLLKIYRKNKLKKVCTTQIARKSVHLAEEEKVLH